MLFDGGNGATNDLANQRRHIIETNKPTNEFDGVEPNDLDLTGADRDGINIGASAAVIVPILGRQRHEQLKSGAALRSPEARRDEAVSLTGAIDLNIRQVEVVTLANVRPATLVGTGKLDELAGMIAASDLEVVIVDHPLTPIQQRNLERAWKVKVLDRTGLILEIFGRRAQTKEGRLQVELAHLMFQRSRLVRSWTHLERQRGGFGFLGGPGETQREADRRIIQDRIDGIRKDLETVSRTRALHRAKRKRTSIPVIALVGYTNAGKSTLFNRLTDSEIYAKDQLFATLDPTMRVLDLPGGLKTVLSDTVGFISELPTSLIAAFRATLEEVLEADLILHVRDIAHADTQAQRDDVLAVLTELGIDVENTDTPLIEVWNKIDLLDDDARVLLDRDTGRADAPAAVAVSAAIGAGLEELREVAEAALRADDWHIAFHLPPTAGALMHWVHENADVLERTPSAVDGGVAYEVRIAPERKTKLLNQLDACPGARLGR